MQVFMPQHGLRHPIVGVVGSAAVRRRSRRGCDPNTAFACIARAAAARRRPVAGAGIPDAKPLTLTTSGVLPQKDRAGRDVILFESPWELRYVTGSNPQIEFHDSM